MQVAHMSQSFSSILGAQNHRYVVTIEQSLQRAMKITRVIMAAITELIYLDQSQILKFTI